VFQAFAKPFAFDLAVAPDRAGTFDICSAFVSMSAGFEVPPPEAQHSETSSGD
jgi:hypothetical protein